MAKKKSAPKKIRCVKDNFDGVRLWKVGEETTEDQLANKDAKRHFTELGGSPEDLLNSVEKETEAAEE